MPLYNRNHTAGDSFRCTLDYSDWLPPGVSISSVTVVSPSLTLTVDTVVVGSSGRVSFFVRGGVVGESPNLALRMVDSIGEIKQDVLSLFVVAP